MHRFGIAGLVSGGKMTDHSTISRFDRANYAITAFLKSPIIGMGAGYVIYVHNGILEILGNCGILGLCTILIKFLPNFRDIINRNAWAVSMVLFVITCFSLESAINQTQIMCFLGLFMGGYHASQKIYDRAEAC